MWLSESAFQSAWWHPSLFMSSGVRLRCQLFTAATTTGVHANGANAVNGGNANGAVSIGANMNGGNGTGMAIEMTPYSAMLKPLVN